MKKIFTLLSLILLFSVVLAGANVAFASEDATINFSCDFEELEPNTKVTKSVMKQLGWNGARDNATDTDTIEVGTIVNDNAQGKCLLWDKGVHAGFNLGDGITSGIIKISFLFKSDTESLDTYATLTNKKDAYSYLNAGTGLVDRSYLSTIGNTIAPCVTGNKTTPATDFSSTDALSASGAWHKIGYVIDMDSKTFTCYVDGVASKTYPIKHTSNASVGSFYFHRDNRGDLYFDDFVVKYEPSDSHTVNSIMDINSEDKYIDIRFDEPLLPASDKMISKDSVGVRKCGSASPMDVTNAAVVNGKVRISYSGEFENGEYRIVFPEGLQSIFGNSVSALYFDAVADDSVSYVKRVRYTDIDGNIIADDLMTPNISSIAITFSEAVDEEALEDITISQGNIGKRLYDNGTNVLTLTLEDFLPQQAQITLTIPESVVSDGETIYHFATTEGSVEFLDLRITSGDAEIADTSLAGKTIAVEADVINTLGVSEDVTVLYLCFNDDELVDVNYKSFSLDRAERLQQIDEEFTVRADITIKTVKAVLMDGSISDLTVFTDAKVYSK